MKITKKQIGEGMIKPELSLSEKINYKKAKCCGTCSLCCHIGSGYYICKMLEKQTHLYGAQVSPIAICKWYEKEQQ